MDSGAWAWQFSQTPDSRACSPAACASSGLYWVIIEPPSTNTSSLLISSLTASKPIAACSQAAGYDAAFAIDFHGPGFLLVNAAGQRFCDETGYEVHERLRAPVNVKPALGFYPALPAYGVCDGRTLRAGALNGVVGTPNDYRWSADNLAEVRRGLGN